MDKMRAWIYSLCSHIVESMVKQLMCWIRDLEVWSLIPVVPIRFKKPWARFESTLPMDTLQ